MYEYRQGGSLSLPRNQRSAGWTLGNPSPPTNKGCAYLSALTMAIHDTWKRATERGEETRTAKKAQPLRPPEACTVQGHTLRAQAHAEGDAHVLHDEVGVLAWLTASLALRTGLGSLGDRAW